jgi:hypothetical protein
MKRLVAFAAGIALMGLSACSSHETKTTVEATPAPKTAEPSYVDRAQQQINDLQARLDSMKPAGAKYQGRHNKNLRSFLNQEYLKLGQAKDTLRQLRTASGEQVTTLQTQLDNELTSIRSDLNARAAE